MADIKPRVTKGQRTIVNYWIPGPIRESALNFQQYMGIKIRFATIKVNNFTFQSLYVNQL